MSHWRGCPLFNVCTMWKSQLNYLINALCVNLNERFPKRYIHWSRRKKRFKKKANGWWGNWSTVDTLEKLSFPFEFMWEIPAFYMCCMCDWRERSLHLLGPLAVTFFFYFFFKWNLLEYPFFFIFDWYITECLRKNIFILNSFDNRNLNSHSTHHRMR